MIKIANAQLWVHDQDEALEFWTKKVGMEVRIDVSFPEMGSFRWITVGPPQQPDVSIVLMGIPGPPVMDEETAEQVRTLVAKGFAGTVFLTTDDCQASYEELKKRGVERPSAIVNSRSSPTMADRRWPIDDRRRYCFLFLSL